MKVALITGITGQDGSYLTEMLLAKGYRVHGIVRRASLYNRSRIEHLRTDPEIYQEHLFLHYADLHDSTSLRRIFEKVQPDEVYHLAGQSHVGLSFEIAESTVQEVGLATLQILEICRDLKRPPRIYHASSSEIFGSPREIPQTEGTAYRPVNPYGCAKAFATQICRVYREAHGMFVASGIAYNHESVRRGENFVTLKIANAAVRWRMGRGQILELGNLQTARDWGHAAEYVEAMWRMLQTDQPDDYILATGERCELRDFARACYRAVGIRLEFEGDGLEETGRDAESGEILIRVHPRYFRRADTSRLVGDPSRIRDRLGWVAGLKGAALGETLVRDLLLSTSPNSHSLPEKV